MMAATATVPAWTAAAVFALVFPLVSYAVQRRLAGGPLACDLRQILLLAALTFAAAIVCESLVNPAYELVFGEKLWEYRMLPLHDRNVSALSLLVWSSYGVHLYFLDQSLSRRFAGRPQGRLFKACAVGVEAPLIWEVSGNAVFLTLLGDYYAYSLPGELLHLTSVRVIPVYIACAYVGLVIYGILRPHARDWRIAGGCFAAGVLFLAVG